MSSFTNYMKAPRQITDKIPKAVNNNLCIFTLPIDSERKQQGEKTSIQGS